MGTKYFTPVMIFLFCFYQQVYAQYQQVKDVRLENGQCFTDPTSKVYLKGYGNPGNENIFKAISESVDITNLRNTNEVNYYFCNATCDINGVRHRIWITQSDNPARFEDMSGFICQGISMERITIVGSVTSFAPVIYPFWAFNSKSKEITNLIKVNKLKITPEQKAVFNGNLKKMFFQIGDAYSKSTLRPMIDAGTTLKYIAEQKPGYDKILDHYLKLLKQSNWSYQIDYNSVDFYIMNALDMHARYLEF